MNGNVRGKKFLKTLFAIPKEIRLKSDVRQSKSSQLSYDLPVFTVYINVLSGAKDILPRNF